MNSARLPPLWVERFWLKVDIGGQMHPYDSRLGQCWVWTGALCRGYGRHTVNKVGKWTHRTAFELYGGVIPPGQDLCHSCNNRACCRPGHLAPGTRGENVRYAFACGRMLRRGEDNGRAKLSEPEAASIRNMKGRYRDIAAVYNVSPSLVGQIKRGEAWKQ